jgi:hypothetical protein
MREPFAVECSSFLASSGHRLGDFISRVFHKKQPSIPSLHGAAYQRRTIRVRFVFMDRDTPAIIRGRYIKIEKFQVAARFHEYQTERASPVVCSRAVEPSSLAARALYVGAVPDSWRGKVLIQGYREGQPFGERSIRDHDALLWGLMALASIGVSLLVVWLGWNRRRWFAVGFLVPAIWAVFYLLQ